MAILIDHRKIPRFRIIKRLHDLIHRRVDYDLGRGGNHELRYMETIIQLRTEHDIPDIIQQDDTQQHAPLVHNREGVTPASGNNLYHIAQRHLRRHHLEIFLDHAIRP